MAYIMVGGEKVMPYKSRVPCKYPGCGKLIQPDTMYCEDHTTLRNSQYEKYDRDKDTKRRSAVHGSGSVTSMLQSIHSVSSDTPKEFWFRQRRSITSYR